jgi:hypothetical protein
MDMQLYALHVVPFIIIVYLIFLLFLRPPKEVILASLLGGLVMGIINALVDLLAFYAHWWHYKATGLVLNLPLPFYITPILVFGGIIYLLMWRFWGGRSHWFALLLLFGVPILGFARDLLSAISPASSFLHWDSFLAGPLDFLLWLLMFYTGFLVFRRTAIRLMKPLVEKSSPNQGSQEPLPNPPPPLQDETAS